MKIRHKIYLFHIINYNKEKYKKNNIMHNQLSKRNSIIKTYEILPTKKKTYEIL